MMRESWQNSAGWNTLAATIVLVDQKGEKMMKRKYRYSGELKEGCVMNSEDGMG